MASIPLGSSYTTLAGQSRTYRPTHRALWTQAGEVLLTWLERTRQRRQLGQLSPHMLKDIGLSRADVEAEVTKPFWQA
ncbi:MAG: DUF1127 domain-containing protein [Geminicoccaceae bacterium]